MTRRSPSRSIDRHLEDGAEIIDAILDGASEIIIPATVSLLSISIVFVPTFGLGGVAGYLFRPMSEAVIISLVASYVLTYTLVPTLPRYLLANQSHDGDEAAPPSSNPLAKFQRGFMHRFERVRLVYRDWLGGGRLRGRGLSSSGCSPWWFCPSDWRRFLDKISSRRSNPRKSSCMFGRQSAPELKRPLVSAIGSNWRYDNSSRLTL